MARLLLIRHGVTDWNEADRWQGHQDEPLNPRGEHQAASLAAALSGHGVQALVSSDLQRARQTAAYLATTCALTPTFCSDLREIATGSWTGLTHADARASDPAGFERHLAGGTGWAGGETYGDLQARAVRWASRLAGEAAPASVIAVVTHGGVIRALVAHALGAGSVAARLHVAPAANAGVTTIEVPPSGAWRLLAYNVPLVV